jgi:hypothetical protein
MARGNQALKGNCALLVKNININIKEIKGVIDSIKRLERRQIIKRQSPKRLLKRVTKLPTDLPQLT